MIAMPEDHGSTSKSFVLLQAAHVKPSFRVLTIGLQGVWTWPTPRFLLGVHAKSGEFFSTLKSMSSGHRRI
jgi:hypothetical protein